MWQWRLIGPLLIKSAAVAELVRQFPEQNLNDETSRADER
jgi:hypothetical protein